MSYRHNCRIVNFCQSIHRMKISRIICRRSLQANNLASLELDRLNSIVIKYYKI